MTVNSPFVNQPLSIIQENHIKRTGLLLYYDPLLLSDMFYTSLSALNVVNNTLSSSTISALPTGINSIQLYLTITTS